MTERKQHIYKIEYVLQYGEVLFEGTLIKSNIPRQMPCVDESHTLVGVIDNGERKIAGEIRDNKDYEDFWKTFGSGAFLVGGKYLICSLPNDKV